MADLTKRNIDQVLSEIESLKSIINQNKTMLYEVSLSGHFRLSSFLLGMAVVVFSCLFYVLTLHFGSYDAIPTYVRVILNVAMVISGIVLLPLTMKLWGDSLQKKNRQLSLEKALDSLVSSRIFTFMLPVDIIAITFAVYFGTHFDPYYVIPTIAIAFGLWRTLIGCVAENYLWSINGYWFLGTALFIALKPIAPPLATGLTFGCGFLLFALSSLLADKTHG